MKKLHFLSLILFTLCSCDNNNVEWVSSTNTEPWVNESKVKWDKAGAASVFDIELFVKNTAQQIDGFGGCFNELSWDALQLLDTARQNDIMKELFTTDGSNFVLGRMPIGANDYSRNYYSLNDSAGDFEMKYFNIERDKKILIPYIKAAMKFNPALKIWGSPWCPPQWMKNNKHYACLANPDVNDLPQSGQRMKGGSSFIMQEEYLKAYALYFARYVQSYRNEGINVYAVHVQNEIGACQTFPSCLWTGESLATFIGQYLGPELEKRKLDAEIWLSTINISNHGPVDKVLNDSLSKKYVKGVGLQWGGKEIIQYLNETYPDIKLMQTESECGNGSNDWKSAEHTWELLKHYLNRGARSYMYWNMILNETGMSGWKWKQNAMITIDSKTRNVTYNPEFYLMKHLSHFIKPGAWRFKTGAENILAFVNPDGKIVLVTGNMAETGKQLSIKIGEKVFSVTLKPKSFNTFSISKY